MKRTKYYILNEDEPYTLWKLCDGTVKVSSNHISSWDKSAVASPDLADLRQISKREAKSLFPLAFPPHTKEGQ